MSNQKSKNKYSLIIFGAVILFAAIIKLYSYHWPKVSVKINNSELKVLVANNPERLHKGLGGREDLGKYDGMLFIFPTEDRHGIVMRGMLFPIDIIWIKDGIVVDIAPNVPLEPGRTESELTVYFARASSDFVLEMPAGQVQSRGIKIGDKFTVGD